MTIGEDDSDEQLAALAKLDNRSAFNALVKRNKDTIYLFIRRYVGQPDDAYDVLQNSFIAAWAGLSRYDPERPFLPWLRVIALNKCRDFGRRQTVRRVLLKAFARERLVEHLIPKDGLDDDAHVEAERLVYLDKAIADLPAFYKEPFLLTVVSGLSHQDAAKMLATTPKAIEMRIYRARRKIFDAMKSHSGEG